MHVKLPPVTSAGEVGASRVISRIESPWYIQSLVACLLIDGASEFNWIDVPGIVDPRNLGAARLASSADA